MAKITYKTRLIFKDILDKEKILQTLKSHQLAWNEASKIKYTMYRNSIVELHAAFYKEFRKNHPGIPSQIVIIAQRGCLSAYRSIRSNKQKIKEPPQRKCLAMRLDKRVYSYKNEVLSLISLNKRVKCKLYKYKKLEKLLSKYKFFDPLISEKNGDIWIAITFDIPELLPKQTLALGVDLGCRVSAATSEGNLFIGKKFNARKRQLRYLKRQLWSKADKGSRTAKKHLKKLSEKERNINRNFSHHLSKKILNTKADTIVLENLKSIKVKKNKYKNSNRISQVPLYQLKQFLKYKAPLLGKTVIEVCPSYTSQIDSQTGKKDGIRQGRRYITSYGKVYDADVNAAINIGLRSKLPLLYGNVVEGQAIVNSPIVSDSYLQSTILKR